MDLDQFQQQQYDNLLTLLFVFLGVAVAWGILSRVINYTTRLRNRLREWEKTMSKKHRSRHEKRILCDIIASALEDAEYEGKITRERKVWAYQQFANNCGLYELLPRRFRPKEADLKEDIRERLGPDVDKKIVQLRAKQQPKTNGKLSAILAHKL